MRGALFSSLTFLLSYSTVESFFLLVKNNHGVYTRRFLGETSEPVFVNKLPNVLKKSCDELTEISPLVSVVPYYISKGLGFSVL